MIVKVRTAQPRDIVWRQGSNTLPAGNTNYGDNPLYFLITLDLYNVLAQSVIVCNDQPTDEDVKHIENIFLVKILCTAKLPVQNLSL